MPANADKASDDEHIFALLRKNGYTLPSRMSAVRFVHLTDNKRKELMFIYTEDAAYHHAADTNALVQRALAGLHLHENP